MNYSEFQQILKEAKPLEKSKVEEAVKRFNDRMESAKNKLRELNQKSEILASQTKLTI